jgi:hypothetical protein
MDLLRIAKSLTRPCKVTAVIVGLVMLAGFSAVPVFANIITIPNVRDSGSGSLRCAITSASPDDTINFSLNLPATITLANTLIINANLTISGPGASSLAISGNNSVTVIHIDAGVSVAIRDLFGRTPIWRKDRVEIGNSG